MGQECDIPVSELGKNSIQKVVYEQPMIIIPIPSPMCNEKWTYGSNGNDWECKCKEGTNQSPINLPPKHEAITIKQNALFEFKTVTRDEETGSLEMVLEDFKLTIHGRFGKLVNWDLVTYEAKKVEFHSKGEHTISNEKYDLEAQIYYDSISAGNIQKKAVVSVLFKGKPGAMNYFFDKTINILDLPDRGETKRQLNKSINLESLFRQDESDSYTPFSYYKYEGSVTSPPCEEETTWYVAHPVIDLSTTVIEYFRDIFKYTPVILYLFMLN